MKIKEVLSALERFAPLPLQESWDNAGLQVGLTETEVSGALLCLDVTEKIVDEAIRKDCGCQLVIDEAAWQEIMAAEPLQGFRQADDHDACFAIYTSGSTGTPKGVLQEYGKIKLNQASLERVPGDLIDENTCMAQAAPLNFIAAVKIFLNALYSGMHLVILTSETVSSPMRLKEQFDLRLPFVAGQGTSCSTMPSSLVQTLSLRVRCTTISISAMSSRFRFVSLATIRVSSIRRRSSATSSKRNVLG